ncbi:hypothetical protein BEN74_04700 [Acinetobacter sp. WCHAc010034]|uniref:hypothetical protein n=1 Tax=Acinetobacter sp. WCHAc010034 TaxID=1879049 RepID=UPI00083A6FE0|nr:hypothetical protein [Acinetobacter sp. WCHAc010034]AYA02239.1 hypothetical protein BEN74_04700 [Acinetobacter sp. WCHAc010034]
MSGELNEHLKYQFTAVNVPISVNEDGEKKRRTFDAEVYSGGLIDNHWYWGRSGVVIDLTNLQLKPKTGLVEEHFGGKRVGVATSYDVGSKFRAKGHFLSNPKAKEIVQDIDEEYPFQMSWWADPESVEEVAPGKTVTVNGQEFMGPLHVFRNVRVHEITICGVGADTQTSVEAFSSKPSSQDKNQPEDTDVTELEQAQAAQKQAEKARDDALEKLKQFKSQKRTDDIAALQTELNTTFSAEDQKAYSEMDDAVFGFMANQFRQFSSKQPPAGQQSQNNTVPPHLAHLFKHQATGGHGGDQSSHNNTHKFTSGAQAFAEQNKGK